MYSQFTWQEIIHAPCYQCDTNNIVVSLTQEIPPPPPPGISMEEAIELQENIERLEGELVELRAELAAKEDANNQLSKEGGRERRGEHTGTYIDNS